MRCGSVESSVSGGFKYAPQAAFFRILHPQVEFLILCHWRYKVFANQRLTQSEAGRAAIQVACLIITTQKKKKASTGD